MVARAEKRIAGEVGEVEEQKHLLVQSEQMSHTVAVDLAAFLVASLVAPEAGPGPEDQLAAAADDAAAVDVVAVAVVLLEVSGRIVATTQY